MFPSLRHKAKQKQYLEIDIQNKIANSIVHKCIRAQERWATYMQHQSEKLSHRVKKVLLIMFFLSSGGFSLFLIVKSLKSHKDKNFSLATIKVPEQLYKAGDEKNNASVISEAEYERINRFILYMDSLAKNPSGKRLYDSILFSRPGLIDSIIIIQKIYNEKD